MPTLALDPAPILETTDSGLLLFRDNVQLNYDKLNAIIGNLRTVEIYTSTARPTNPYVGQVILETDTGAEVWWVGTEWHRVVGIISSVYLNSNFSGGGAGSTASTSYVDAPGPMDLAFTKRATATTLEIDLRTSAFMTGAIGRIDMAVAIGGTDYFVASFFGNELLSHKHFTGIVQITGLAAGASTARLRWKVTSGTANVNADDPIQIKITEMK